MRENAKRPTAGSNQRRANGLGRILRGSFATRGASAGVQGSGAPSRGRIVVLSLAAAVLATSLLAASALAGKQGIFTFGGLGANDGGDFQLIADVAVNTSGAGPADPGDVYVVDAANNRVQRFDDEGNFISTWGIDVTDPDGGTDFEVCTEASQCRQGDASGGNGTLAGNGGLNRPQHVAVDQDTGVLYVSDRGNRRINAYDGAGGFLFSVGRDVAEPDGATELEVCDGETEVCRQGDAGSGPGEIGSTTQEPSLGLAVSPPDGEAATGTLYLADTQNRRVNTYALDGTSPASFGSSANFGTSQPREVAVDSRGIVYASDGQNGAEIERYDSEDANGGGVGFLAPIAASLNEVQTISFSGMSFHDEFTLSCPGDGTTPPIEWAFDGNFGANLRAGVKAGCGVGNVDVFTPSPIGSKALLLFTGAFEATDVPSTVCTPLDAGSCSVTEESNGLTAALLPANHHEFPARVETATRGLEVDPDSDGAGPDEDVLHVLRRRGDSVGGVAEVQQFGPLNDPGLTAAPGEDDDRHGGNVDIDQAAGLGLDDSLGRFYVSERNSSRGVIVLADPPPDPVVAMDPITVKTDSTATFSGTVDPQGGAVGCRFEYSTDESNWIEVPEPDCASLAVNGGSQAVDEEVEGLDPNTTYFVRLHVFRSLDSSAPTVNSTVRSFDTDAVPPVITDVGAVQVQDTSARLVGTIDPRNNPTEYVFEYGTSPGLGSATEPVGIGGGTTPITVSQLIEGLQADTDYFFRLTATNPAGTSMSPLQTLHTRAVPFPPAGPGNCPNQAIRAEQGTTHLPACRAYEMVTPTDKNQGSLDLRNAAFSEDGNGASFTTSTLFGDPPSQQGQALAPYISKRGPGGWTTPTILPRYCVIDYDDPQSNQVLKVRLSADYGHAVLAKPEAASCKVPPIDPAAPLPSLNLYRADFTTQPFGFDLLAPNPAPGETTISDEAAGFAGASPDFGLVLYHSDSNQTAPPDSPPPGDFSKLYGWQEQGHGDCTTPGGCLSLVSVDPSGEPFTTSSSSASFASSPDRKVSDGGERVYFQNVSTVAGTGSFSCTGPACRLYLREGGAQTLAVSAPECAVPADCGANSSPDVFRQASPEGDSALFISCDKLTDASAPGEPCTSQVFTTAATGKLYRWLRDAPEGGRLVDLSVDEEPADGTQPRVLDIVGASDDQETVFFVAGGQIVAGEPTHADLKLYRWRWNAGSPAVEYLAPYRSITQFGADSTTSVAGDQNADLKLSRVTADGGYLLIRTRLALNPAGDADADADLYRWSEAEGWRCVSCQLPGLPSAGEATGTFADLGEGLITGGMENIWRLRPMSEDGRVFFTTPDALVAHDINDQGNCPASTAGGAAGGVHYRCQDVYEWNDGTLSLLSGGTESDPTASPPILIGTTADGKSVFFITLERLVGWDADNGRDIYVARSGGGFPEPAPLPPECEGEGCREEGTDAPATVGAGSAVFQGAGNPKPEARGRRCPANRLRRGKRCLTVAQIARKRCRRLEGQAKRRCVRKQARRLRRAQRRAKRRAQRRNRAANLDRRAGR